MNKQILGIVIVVILALSTLISCNESSKTISETPKDTILPSKLDTFCFEKREGLKLEDVTSVKLIISSDSVNGTMEWLPFEKDGAVGTLKGIKKGDELFVTFNYVIEGSNQLEDMIFKIEGDTLYQKEGALKELSADPPHFALQNADSSSYTIKLNKVYCK